MMRKSLRAVLVAAGAVTALFTSTAMAAAETTAYGAPFTAGPIPTPNCVNSVVMGRDSGQIYAYAIMKCGGNKSILNPDVGLSGDNGNSGLVGKVGSCALTFYCESPRVYLPENPGVTYRASSDGSIDDNFTPPAESNIAHAQLIGGGHNFHAGTEAGTGRVRWADFDGDGSADYWIINPDGSVHVYLNKGTDGHGGWQDIGQVATGLTTDASRVRFADWDGDGRADYILIAGDGSVHVFLNKGGDGHGGWQDIGQVATGLTTDASRVRFADIDGDGRADYCVLDGNGGIHAYLNRGGDTSGGWVDDGQIASGLTGDLSRIRLADIDGDGKADYSVINPDGSVTTYQNNGGDGHGGWINYGHIATGLTTDQNAVVFADITGDGRADYLLTNSDGSVNAFVNNGGDGHGGWIDYGRIAAGA
ncbi:hypothetical protein ABH930_007426 [Kitasatospora sp. GAS204A]|uniref:FG-GAP repeat domain-containing protein n=1 Tax=unclassified Kitasatospora TaxID=2633591 RepID=UPI0024768E57|nr:VCBS repeat-containing protein [Kitasatospora sp. GAS204B]MDH6123047.1 hypothetical protein [Kitasatospora sp. GAS204B]